MSRTIPPLCLAILAIAPGRSDAQQFIGRGSTVQGDILRGEGVFLNGAGQYNYYTAMANSIDTDTAIRLNEYIYQSYKSMARDYAVRRAQEQRQNRKNYEAILDRIMKQPERKDLERGDALNDRKKQLQDPALIAPSTMRLNPVPLPVSDVRTIPFMFASQGASISIKRLSDRKRVWPIGLRGSTYERRVYERAIDSALEEIAVGKLSKEAIGRIEAAIAGLNRSLDREFAGRTGDELYGFAHKHLMDLGRAAEQLKRPDVERIIGELDKYSGTTVQELVEFMGRNGLQFAPAEYGDEMQLYPRVFASLEQQLTATKNSPGNRGDAK